jgi:hypothetical protein
VYQATARLAPQGRPWPHQNRPEERIDRRLSEHTPQLRLKLELVGNHKRQSDAELIQERDPSSERPPIDILLARMSGSSAKRLRFFNSK